MDKRRINYVSRIVLQISFALLTSLCFGSDSDCIIKTARAEIGVHEVGGNNKGKKVSEYLANANVFTPAPWCAAFVKWVLDQCGVSHSITAWSPSATAKNRVYDRRYPDKYSQTPQRGDVFTLYYPNLKRIGHTGFVEKWGDKWVTTVEGNTNDAGARDSQTGDMVMRKWRWKKTIHQVSRY